MGGGSELEQRLKESEERAVRLQRELDETRSGSVSLQSARPAEKRERVSAIRLFRLC